MSRGIHPTAIIESGAELGEDVAIGAYAYVGSEVTLDAGTKLHHHANVEGLTSVGKKCEIFPFTCIGTKTQDLKYKNSRVGVCIGDCNVFREYVSIHSATNDGGFTVVENDNLFLAHSHIAHDCKIGSNIIASNEVGIAGHCVIKNYVTIGAKCGIHQFCRIGTHVMVGAMSKVVQDVPPFVVADGNPAIARSINKIGMERLGFSAERIDAIKYAFRLFYRSGCSRSQTLEKMRTHTFGNAGAGDFQYFLQFIEQSKRGVVAGH